LAHLPSEGAGIEDLEDERASLVFTGMKEIPGTVSDLASEL
jgi:hypothetical protein